MITHSCKYLFSVFLAFWVLVLPLAPHAQETAPPPDTKETAQQDTEDTRPIKNTVLIRNVTLMDQTERKEKKDAIINILIRDKSLDLITKEEIPVDRAEQAFDANKGFLLGKIKPGELPSFLIIDRDPRLDFDALLDTGSHAIFAIRKGEILLNGLQQAIQVKEVPKRSAWLAYTPPPMSLATSYVDTTKWNRWDTKYVSGLFFAALALDRQYWMSQDKSSRIQVGELDDFEGGEIRALRFGLLGTLNFPQPWVYYISAATNAFNRGFGSDNLDSLTILDLRVDIPLYAKTTLSIGKQKEPISMERLMALTFLPMQERASVSDTLLRSRNIGVLLSGTAFNQRVTWAGGVFNDWLESSGDFDDNTTAFTGRVTWLPFITEDSSNLLHLGFGWRYSNAKEPLRGAIEPEFIQSPVYADTGLFSAKNTKTYNLEASWRKGPFWLGSELLLIDIDSPAFGNPVLSGYHITASWTLTGEMRDYNRKNGLFQPLPVAKSVFQDGWGTWEVATRWSTLDLNDGNLTGGNLNIFSFGLNWWLTPEFSLSVNHRWINLDRFGLDGDSNGLNARIVLLLS